MIATANRVTEGLNPSNLSFSARQRIVHTAQAYEFKPMNSGLK
jgi:hypothetical protein